MFDMIKGAIGGLFANQPDQSTNPHASMQQKQAFGKSQRHMEDYAGKNVIVTGATGAIGSKVCRKLKKAGVRTLVMFIRNKDRFDVKTYEQLFGNESITNVATIECDFCEPQYIEQKFTQVMKQNLKGQLDHMFLCHGLVTDFNVSQCDLPEFDTALKVNVRSCVHLCSLAFPFMKENVKNKHH